MRASDIDGARSQLNIRNGKGNKARVVPASPRLLEALRIYWKINRQRVLLEARYKLDAGNLAGD